MQDEPNAPHISNHESQGDPGTPDASHLSRLIDDLGGVVWEFDWSTGAFTFVSEGAERLLGFPASDWLRPGFWVERLHPDDAAWAPGFCQAATDRRENHDFEYRMYRADGSVVWVRDIVTVDAERGLAGKLRGLIVDITDRKRAEEQAQASERRLRTMVEDMGLLGVAVDAAGLVTYANEHARALLGIEPGVHFLEAAEAESRPTASAAFGQALRAGHVQPFDHPMRAADGSPRTIHWNAVASHGPNGEFAGAIALGEDITERAVLERQIQRRAEEFDAIFALTRDLYFRMDPDLVITGYSAPSNDSLYAPPDAFLGKPVSTVLPTEVAEMVARGAADAHATQSVTTCEYSMPLGGDEREWEARFLPMPDGDTAALVRDVTLRNRRNASLAESEQRYRTLVELAPYAIYVVDLNDRILFGNRAAADLLGASEVDQLIGLDIGRLVPEGAGDTLEQNRRMALQTAAGGTSDEPPSAPPVRCELVTLEGRTIQIERTVAGITFQRRPALMVISRDVTEEIERERAVRESRDMLEKLLGMLDSGVIVVSGADRTITSANRPAERLLGFDPGEMIGQSTRIMHPSDESWTEFNDSVRAALSIGDTYSAETILQHKNGRAFDAEIAIRNLEGGFGGDRIGIIRDISQRKADERLLRDSEERFRSMVEQSPVGMHFYRIVSDDLFFIGANPAADEILGIEHAPLIGKTIEQAFPGLVETPIPGIYRNIAENGGVWNSASVDYDDGEIRGAYEVQAFRIQPGSVAVTFSDMTERKRAEDRERAYQRRLSAFAVDLTNAEDAERRRLAEELHDRVGQALAVAMMHLRAAEGGDTGACDVDELRIGSQLLESAIRETRAITTELFPPVLSELGLAAAVRWLCEETEQAHNLACTAITPDDVTGLSDEARNVLFRATRELLNNVVRHSGAREARVSLTADVGGVELVVEDDGAGFDPETISTGGSSGFGLFSIADRLPHLGGEIDIDSSPGEGSRVTVRMPWSHAIGEATAP